MGPPLSRSKCLVILSEVQHIQHENVFTPYCKKSQNFYLNIHWLGNLLTYHVKTLNIIWMGSGIRKCYIFIWSIPLPNCSCNRFMSDWKKTILHGIAQYSEIWSFFRRHCCFFRFPVLQKSMEYLRNQDDNISPSTMCSPLISFWSNLRSILAEVNHLDWSK